MRQADNCQYYWQEQRDSRLIPHGSCPDNRIHLIHLRKELPGSIVALTRSNLRD